MKALHLRRVLLLLTVWFSCSIDIFAQAQQESANIEGFRSAKFGIDQSQTLKAIEQDFNIKENDITIQKNPLEQTTSLKASVNDLLPNSGPSEIFYILGHTTNNLIQINIIWTASQDETQRINNMAVTAETLKSYFLRQGFKKDDMVINAQLKDGSILFFRGTDTQGRMVILQMLNPPKKESETSDNKTTSLRLTYVEDPNAPDIFQVKQGDF